MLDLVDKYVIGPWTTIWSTAPVPFVMSVAAIGIIIFITMKWGYGRENSLLRQQVADYKDKLSGATPAEAKAQFLALEARISELTADTWEPLSQNQINRIAARLSRVPKRPVHIAYHGAHCMALARSLRILFDKLEWPRADGSTMIWGSMTGITIYPGDEIGIALSDALVSESDLPVVVDSDKQPDAVTEIFIGTKPI